MKTKNTNQDQWAIIIGFGLIILVAIITIWRSMEFKKDPKQNSVDSSSASQEKIKTISTLDLQEKINKKESLTILDVRTLEAYNEEHILDATNIPVDELEKNSSLDSSKPTYIVAENSQDDSIKKTFTILKNKKFQNIFVLAGGMESWKNLRGQTITSGDPTSFANQAKVYHITAEELRDNLDSGKIFLIDTRSQADFVQGHIKNAINIPFEELEKRRDEISINKNIVIYDANEVFGFQSTVRIYDLLSIPAYNLREGFDGWKNKNFEIVK